MDSNRLTWQKCEGATGRALKLAKEKLIGDVATFFLNVWIGPQRHSECWDRTQASGG